MFLLRSGLLGLRLWVRRSACRRDSCLKALIHRNHVVVQAKSSAWKNKLYPLGLRVQWSPRTPPCTNACDAGGTKDALTHQFALRSQKMVCLETTEAARAQASRGSSGYTKLALLRLSMIRRRVRRMLLLWRKQTDKEMRVRYIRRTLPQVIWCVCSRGVLAACSHRGKF